MGSKYYLFQRRILRTGPARQGKQEKVSKQENNNEVHHRISYRIYFRFAARGHQRR